MLRSNNVLMRLIKSPDKSAWIRNYYRYKMEKIRRSLLKSSRADSSSDACKFRIFTVDGLYLLLDKFSFIDRFIIENSKWEQPQVSLLTSVAREFRGQSRVVFLDIGACWGLYSLYMLGAEVDRVLAFEPDPGNYAQLLAQLLLNDALEKVEVKNIALSSDEQVVSFKSDFYGDGNRGTSRIVLGMEGGRKVRTSRLDKIFEETGCLIIAKIDVEGHQESVLLGMRDSIERNRVFLQVEIDDRAFDSFDFQARSLGLKRCGIIDADHYYTNLDDEIVRGLVSLSPRIVRA